MQDKEYYLASIPTIRHNRPDMMKSGNLDLLPAPQAHSDAQLIEIWLHGRSPHTQRAYARRYRPLLAPGQGSRSPAVTLADLQNFADSLGRSGPRQPLPHPLRVKSLLGFGHRIGYLPFDVGRALRLPAMRSRLAERILPEADVHRMLSLEPTPRNRAILLLLYASGVRVSELCGLCWRDVQPNGDGVQITVFGKGAKTRAIQLPESVAKLLDTRPRRCRR